MEDIVPELLEKIKKEYANGIGGVNSSETFQKIMKSTQFGDAYTYGQETAEVLVKVLGDNITADTLPDGKMYYNIANRILPEMYRQAYEDTAAVAEVIQGNLNAANNIGLKVLTPEFNTDRTKQIVEKVTEADSFSDVSWMLKKPVIENITMSAVDDTIKCNAEFHVRSGRRAKIVRTLAGKCCEWCQEVAGTYSYPDVPDDVYRRHKNCRCKVDYIPVGGDKAQDVWSKKWKDTAPTQTKDDIAFWEEFEKKKRKAKNNGDYCIDATEKWERNKQSVKSIKNNDHYVVKNGVRYEVDGVRVKFNPSPREREVAELLVERYGGRMELNPQINFPLGVQMADYTWNGKYYDLKGIEGTSSSVIKRAAKKSKGQSDRFIFDISKESITTKEAIRQIKEDLFKSTDTAFVDTALLIKDSTIISIFERI